MFTRTTIRRSAAAAAVLLALAGCGSMTAEDFKTILGGVTDVARTAGEFEANRRAARAGAAPQAQATQGVPQSVQPQAVSYGALSCARPTSRNGLACMENGCGRMVMVHARSSGGATGVYAVAPGQCSPVAPGSVAFACSAGDRFDWQRGACIGS